MPAFPRFGIIPWLLAAPAAALAQEHAHHGTEKLGRVVFPVSCNPAAQQRFERAMAVLHSFWWEEGGKAFRSVLEADPSCAMAWWGLAMHAWNNPFAGGPSSAQLAAGREAAAKAVKLGGRTPREAGFIAAASALYRDAANRVNVLRLRAYSDTLARVHRDHPDDEEVTIYYALSLVATASPTDTTFARQKQAAALLNPLFVKHPDHPGLAHYIIHANDSPHLAYLGLDAARRYAEIAPSAPHAQHMPSHIFVRLGMWDETVASNWKAFEAGAAHARAMKQPVQYEQLHALDYAVYAYLQQGQDREARRTVRVADSVATAGNTGTLVGGYNRTAMEARIPLERGEWQVAAKFQPRVAPSPVVVMLISFTRGIGAARSGNPAAARRDIATLDSVARLFRVGPDPDWGRIADIKRQSVEAWTRFAAGDTTGGLVLAHAAAELEDVTEKKAVTPGEPLPARELEADMLLAAARFADARRAYQATLTREPGRGRSLFGVGRAAELAGDRAGAVEGYQQYLKMMEKADGDRPELAIARRYLQQ